MKKTIFTLALLAGLAGTAQAQNISLGLKAGPTYASFIGKDAGEREGLFGFHAGVFANIGLSNMVAFQPELLYSQKGSKVANVTDYRTRFSYLDVPLAFHLNADGLFFEAGPQVGFLLAAKAETGNVAVDVKDATNSVDFGYLAGLGYQRKTGLGIGLRYNGGVTNLPKAVTVGNTTVQNRLRNSVFQLYLTYSFGG
ncbi:porin family protein [Hymenobacter properus]|uniref:PorT family protein n=1 Tax=Hymenobacter properus TaxID=2791026 RepID=A0A931BFC2_9BACT|nr:porin family protein [Hymenobacter properus]MBF9142399.1 PorT family protein [Hymenobacter properus]MBR7721206.1 PorT family protein [Microvirga sp. SRT04]